MPLTRLNLDLEILGTPAFLISVETGSVLRYRAANEALVRLSGIDRSRYIDHTPAECLSPATAQHVETQYRHCLQTGLVHEYEQELELPVGRKWWRTTLLPLVDAEQRIVGILGTWVDITEAKRRENELLDPLTGLSNRRRFEIDCGDAIFRALETGRAFSVLLIDILGLSALNAAHGRSAGDDILCTTALRVREAVREQDRVAAFGGGRFGALISAATEGSLTVAMDRVRRHLAGPFRIGEAAVSVPIAVAGTLWTPGCSLDDILDAGFRALAAEKLWLAQAPSGSHELPRLRPG